MRDWWLWLLVLVIAAGCGGPVKTAGDLKGQAIAFNESGYEYYRQSRWNRPRLRKGVKSKTLL